MAQFIVAPKGAHDTVIRAMCKIQQDHPFFSYILMHFKVTAKNDKRIDTCGVDKHGNFFYDENFITSLIPEEVRGVLVHETMHIAKGDFFRMGNRDKFIWNIASDMVINYIIKQEGFTLPKCTINPNHAGDVTIGGKTYNVAKKATEDVYDELIENAQKIQQQLGKGKGDGGKGGKEEDLGHGGFDQHLDDEKDPAQSAAAESKWKKVTIEAATNARARGKMPGCAESFVDKLLNPTIDWRSRIQKFITNEIPIDFTNRLPSRKFYATGVWTPRVLRENLDVFVSVDVSGSTSPDRKYFISEVAAILGAYEQINARLIFWDYVVHEANDHQITRQNKDTLTELKIVDCDGGTKFSAYEEYLNEKDYKCRLHIVFTDGQIEHNPKVPNGNIIFVLTKNGEDSIIKDYGAVCRISDTDEN